MFGVFNYFQNFYMQPLCSFNNYWLNSFVPCFNFFTPTTSYSFNFSNPFSYNSSNYMSYNTPSYTLATPSYTQSLSTYTPSNPFSYSGTSVFSNPFTSNNQSNYFNNTTTSSTPSYWSTLGLNLSTKSKSTPTITPSQSTQYKVGKFDMNYWKSQGYNANMGQKLAMDAVKTCPGHADGGCVGYTRRTLNRLYGTNFSNAGKAYQFGSKILSSPALKGKFKKVSTSSLAHGIPDGAIVLWKPGAPGYTRGKAALYGHGGIAYNNKVYSDCVIRNLSTCCEIWIPV